MNAIAEALRHHQAGRLAEADRLYQAILIEEPRQADAWHLAGVLAFQRGRAESAIPLIGRGIAVNPASATYRSNQAPALRAAGRLGEAVQSCRAALVLRPDHRDALNNLGQSLQDLDLPAAHCFIRALALDPAFPEAHNNIGNELRAAGDLAAAARAYGQALARRPDYAEAHNNLAVSLTLLGETGEAVTAGRRSVVLKPDYAEAYNTVGNALRDHGNLDAAVACYGRARMIWSAYPDALNNLGNVYKDQGRLDEALNCFRQALALKEDPNSFNNLAGALMAQGQLDQALDSFERAVALDPAYLSVLSNMIMALHYSDQRDAADILTVARQFDRALKRPAQPRRYRNSREKERRLRIGYVSADFKSHPVGFFLIRTLESRDPAALEIVCYTNASTADSMTRRLAASADRWRSIVGLTDRQAAMVIAEDEIDILVDLAGHTGDNRLSLFALRPAPVQATWLGYFGTTGLSCIDYILADDVVLPPGDEAYYSEKPWRLPGCYLCYEPHGLTVATGPFPGLAKGEITFGCFNNGTKITEATIACWSEVLWRVEKSRLLLKTRSLADPAARTLMQERFTRHGIASDRLILEGHSPLDQAMARYNDIDIALDPFPFCGCTTTAETLWMGVPVITLKGDRWSGRMSETILARLDMLDWVAKDLADYVEIAVDRASRLSDFTGLRAGLRQRLEQSSFCDGPAFAAALQAAYRGMWRVWCESDVT